MTERTNTGRRVEDSTHCEHHGHNTELIESHGTDLGSIKTKLAIAQWLLGIGMATIMVMVQIAITKLDAIYAAQSTGKEQIARLERDIAHIDTRVSEIEDRHLYLDQRKVR